MRWPHFRTRLVGVHNPARCLAMTRICHPRLRRRCGSESRSGPGRDVEAARVDYVVTGAEARRVRVAVLSRATRAHLLGTAVQHWPSFFASETPGEMARRARPVEKPPDRRAAYPVDGRQTP